MNSFYMELSARDRVDGWRREADQARRARQRPAEPRRSLGLGSRPARRRLLVTAVLVIAGLLAGLLHASPASAAGAVADRVNDVDTLLAVAFPPR